MEKSPQKVRAAQYGKADVTRLRFTHGVEAVRVTIQLRFAGLENLKLRHVGFTVSTPDDSFTYPAPWTSRP